VVIEQIRAMASEAGPTPHHPNTLPISISACPNKIEDWRLCQEIGIDRVDLTLRRRRRQLMRVIDRAVR